MTIINHKYEIEKTTDRGYILYIDEKPSVCPFVPLVMVPGQIPGTASMMRMPCSTQCPMAKVVALSGPYETEYITSCGHNDIKKIVTEKESPKQQTSSGILKSL